MKKDKINTLNLIMILIIIAIIIFSIINIWKIGYDTGWIDGSSYVVELYKSCGV